MDFSLIIILAITFPIVGLFVIISMKMIAGKGIPNSDYTPFDYITGQTTTEFHEEKVVREEKDDQGDDKDKHLLK